MRRGCSHRHRRYVGPSVQAARPRQIPSHRAPFSGMDQQTATIVELTPRSSVRPRKLSIGTGEVVHIARGVMSHSQRLAPSLAAQPHTIATARTRFSTAVWLFHVEWAYRQAQTMQRKARNAPLAVVPRAVATPSHAGSPLRCALARGRRLNPAHFARPSTRSVFVQVIRRIHSLVEDADYVDQVLVFLEKKHMRSDEYFTVTRSHMLRRLTRLRTVS